MRERLSSQEQESFEDPTKVSIVVDDEKSEQALVRVVDARKAHQVAAELTQRFPEAVVMEFGGIDFLREE